MITYHVTYLVTMRSKSCVMKSDVNLSPLTVSQATMTMMATANGIAAKALFSAGLTMKAMKKLARKRATARRQWYTRKGKANGRALADAAYTVVDELRHVTNQAR